MKVSAPEGTEEVRAEGIEPTADKMIVEGYAVLFDQPQTYTWGKQTYTEIISRNALASADMKRVVMRYNHNDTVFAMARVKNGSLQLIEDETGLRVRADLIDTQSNRDLYRMIKDGLIDEMSFAFTVAPSGDVWEYSDDYQTVKRTINQIETVYDVSAVDNGFYENTSVYARAFEGADALKKEAEQKKLALEKARAIALANA
ncbi:MAG: HK97 family phage prohead protease [Oscillospiraceae bacterium]|nr:HK97 family phage prohead protease [Oscillospiraceae bacterium]